LPIELVIGDFLIGDSRAGADRTNQQSPISNQQGIKDPKSKILKWICTSF
jgi:hypothetical protein